MTSLFPNTELGIDLKAIIGRFRAILLYRVGSKSVEELDMAGAILCIFLLAGFHLLVSERLM
jgi:protein YIPF5/7